MRREGRIVRPELRMCATPNIIGASRVPNLHGVELAGYGILTAAGQSFAHLWRALGIVCAESNWRKQSSFLIHGAMERQRRSSGLRFRTSRRSAKFRLFQSRRSSGRRLPMSAIESGISPLVHVPLAARSGDAHHREPVSHGAALSL